MRESLRVFQAQRGYATAVVLVLSLCIGANSALFTVVNALVLRPLPFPHSERLVEISIPGRRVRLDDLQRARSIELRIVARLDEAIRDYASPQGFTTALLAVFAAIGLALAAAGVYGVMRYWVASRTGEIGIRIALGAQRADVLRPVLGRASAAAPCGVAGGLAGAIALRQVIATQLVGVSAADPMVLGAVAVVILAVAELAAWAPARRASRIDPAEALRVE
jgi:ABC-type lipoprotein release transport system permease subunit